VTDEVFSSFRQAKFSSFWLRVDLAISEKDQDVEHISVDSVIRPAASRTETATTPTADGRCDTPILPGERPSSRLTARLSVSCRAAKPTISGAAFGLKPRKSDGGQSERDDEIRGKRFFSDGAPPRETRARGYEGRVVGRHHRYLQAQQAQQALARHSHRHWNLKEGQDNQ
jgi:hypothetical protein